MKASEFIEICEKNDGTEWSCFYDTDRTIMLSVWKDTISGPTPEYTLSYGACRIEEADKLQANFSDTAVFFYYGTMNLGTLDTTKLEACE